MAAAQRPNSAPTRSGTTSVDTRPSSPGSRQAVPSTPRRARRMASRRVISEAAAALFLEQGYQETSMEAIATAAKVSKQTIYTHFADKEALFADLVLGNVHRVDAFVNSLAQAIPATGDVAEGLRQIARQYLRIVIRPEVLQLRRLVIAEASRFPALARTYYERVPLRVYDALTDLLRQLGDQGNLFVPDPQIAAQHFAWLLLGQSLDKAMFNDPNDTPSIDELERLADAAVSVFLSAYGLPPAAGAS